MGLACHRECSENTTTSITMLRLAVEMLAHDARRPFSLLRVVISKIKRARSLEEMHDICEHMLPRIDRAVVHVEEMVQDILDIGRIRTRHQHGDVSLGHILDTAIKQCTDLDPEAQGRINYSIYEGYVTQGDEHKLLRAFTNIVSNALEATAKQGKVWIRMAARDDKVEIRIGNTGSYVQPKYRQRIFESFFTRGKARGTGLGLTIAKQVMLAHGGSIDCVSRRDESHPDGCTEFICTLPLTSISDCLQRGQYKLVAAKPTGQRDHILLVEDDPFIAQEWQIYFADRLAVHVAADPFALLDHIRVNPGFLTQFKLVVTDFYFDNCKLDGLQLAGELRARLPTLPVYLATDASLDVGRREAHISGRIDKLPAALELMLSDSEKVNVTGICDKN
ncbi:MAG: hybrid sensor histidine kinase/response regulator [Deltaproteobacteria bacterium]|nr:hybrid sensor histidine kinase/response regulator [Deltaproteobacteria bacterium]